MKIYLLYCNEVGFSLKGGGGVCNKFIVLYMCMCIVKKINLLKGVKYKFIINRILICVYILF